MNDVHKILFVNCPRCGAKTAYTNNPNRPFCSESCRNIDLVNWDDESYSIPGPEVPTTDDEETDGLS